MMDHTPAIEKLLDEQTAPEPVAVSLAFHDNASAVSSVVKRLVIVVVAAFALAGCAHQAHSPSAPSSDASSAPAPKALSGTYTFFADGTRQTVKGQPRAGGMPSRTTWRIVACGAGRAHVVSSLGWTAELHLVQNAWKATRSTDVDCGHGASTIAYSIDADTLSGTVTNYVPCGSTPSTFVEPAELTKTETPGSQISSFAPTKPRCGAEAGTGHLIAGAASPRLRAA
jgi:hypothetical protein